VGGATVTVSPAVCALAPGIVPAKQAAAKAKHVAVFMIIPSPLCRGPHSHLLEVISKLVASDLPGIDGHQVSENFRPGFLGHAR
jgi:hypothetical protein